MFDFKSNRMTHVPRKTLYRVWIQPHEGDHAPLICVWIDPSMTLFESRAKVHEPEAAAEGAGSDEKLAEESPSQPVGEK